jgi:proteasome lid subunit RPN8/RPN11
MFMQIPTEFLAAIDGHAIREYPRECCGLGWGPRSGERVTGWKACRNIAEDGADGLQTIRRYEIDPEDLLAVRHGLAAGESIRLIYHSHPDRPALFSEEDRSWAVHGSTPLYPDAFYLIVSVSANRVEERALYGWDFQTKSCRRIS